MRVPLAIRRRPGRKIVVTPEHPRRKASPVAAAVTRADSALVKALARAFRYQRLLDDGHYASITETAEAERLDRGYMGRLLQLTLLAPDIVEAILDGRPAGAPALPPLMHPFPVGWAEQRSALEVGRRSQTTDRRMECITFTMIEQGTIRRIGADEEVGVAIVACHGHVIACTDFLTIIRQE
jgi:hypothetical protein